MSSARGLVRRVASMLVASALAAAAGDAVAQAPPAAAPGDAAAVDAAREHFQRGLALTKAGKLAEALVAFQQAYDRSPTYRILYNIGQVSRHTGDPARSLRAFERYLAGGGAEIDKKRRAEVEGEIATLRPLVGSVSVRVEPDGAAVLLDGVKIGDAPLAAPYWVNPGAHRVGAEHAGRTPAAQEIEVGAGQSVDVALALEPEPAAPAKAARPETPQPPDARDASAARAPTWIGWVATGVLAAGAITTGVIAVASAGELDDARYAGPDRRPAPDSDVRAIQSRVDALAIVTDVLAGAAAVGLGVTLVWTFTQPSGPAGGATRAAPSVRVSAAGPGLSIAGAF